MTASTPSILQVIASFYCCSLNGLISQKQKLEQEVIHWLSSSLIGKLGYQVLPESSNCLLPPKVYCFSSFSFIICTMQSHLVLADKETVCNNLSRESEDEKLRDLLSWTESLRKRSHWKAGLISLSFCCEQHNYQPCTIVGYINHIQTHL